MERKLLLVVHHLDEHTSIEQAGIAFRAGAQGVFLISHDGADEALFAPAMQIKRHHPHRLVGLNLLTFSAQAALDKVEQLGLDMVWVDDPGVRSNEVTAAARDIGTRLADNGGRVLFFASVAFKYQALDPDPPAAALAAARLGMIPTTSGSATGSAAAPGKILSMRQALGPQGGLALASGITPENVRDYLPYVTHYLAATGVSLDEHHFDEGRARALASLVSSA